MSVLHARMANPSETKRDRWTLISMLFSSLLCLVASFVLSVDAITLAGNKNAVLSCDINAVISCGTVAQSWQASVLGFPNAFIGLVCEPVIVMLSLSMLLKVRFPKWFMLAANFVYLAGLAFALWLFSQSLLVIHAFCPWCILVTLGTIITFFSLTRLNIFSGILINRESKSGAPILSAVRNRMDVALAFLLVTVVFGLVIVFYGAQLFS